MRIGSKKLQFAWEKRSWYLMSKLTGVLLVYNDPQSGFYFCPYADEWKRVILGRT